MKKSTQAAAAVAGAVVLLAGGFAGGVLYERGDGGPQNFGAEHKGACETLTGSSNLKELDRTVPEARSFAVVEKSNASATNFAASCGVRADSDTALTLSVGQKAYGSFAAWEKSLTDIKLLGPTGRERLRDHGGGWSTPTVAALYVPCAPKGPEGAKKGEGEGDEGEGEGEGEALSVVAAVPAKGGGEHRADLVTLVRRTAKFSSTLAGCEEKG